MATATLERPVEEAPKERPKSQGQLLGEKIAKKLEGFGIAAKTYVRGPSGPEIFSLAIDKGKIMLWPGAAEITVYGTSKQRQVVINAIEKRRKVTHEVTLVRMWSGGTTLRGLGPKEVRITKNLRAELIRQFPVAFPDQDAVQWEVSNLQETTKPPPVETFNNKEYRDFKATVTATVPASRQSFLVGYDESALFISMLPKLAKSVKDAHKMLRPKGVDHRAVRQGEWFFQPAPEPIAKQLDARVAKNPDLMGRSKRLGGFRMGGNETTHQADYIRHRGKYYAIGWVTDRRKTHHAPLFLADWHRIVRNREIEPPAQHAARRRTFD